MNSNKDEILANFQVCTGIEDYGEAFVYLESCNWDLLEALNKAIPDQPSSVGPFPLRNHGTSTSFQNSSSIEDEPEIIDLPGEDVPPPLSTIVSSKITSNATHTPAVIDLKIQVSCAGVPDESSFPLEIPGSTTVGELQTMLHHLVGIPPCKQILEGFEQPVQPDLVITHNILPKNLTLILNTSDSISSTTNPFERLNGSSRNDYYNFVIHDEKNGKNHTLHNYPGSKTIKDLKSDTFHLTNITVRHQLWLGWPPNVNDNTSIATSGVPKEHSFTVNQLAEKSSRKTKNSVVNGSEENSSADEFEDASSEMIQDDDFLVMCDAPRAQRPSTLIPENISSEEEGCQRFSEEFSNRYGPCMPLFFRGSLSNALKNSVMLPAKQRKLLAVYLHHDSSVLSNVFCSQTLCHLSLVDYLTSNFIIWGWDMTHESNKTKLLDLVTTQFGVVAASTVKSIKDDKLPALMVINRSRGSIEVLSVINGNCVLDEVMMSLLHAHEMFEEQRRNEVREEEEREARETVKAEQDAAYLVSLEADRAKSEAKIIAEVREREERERQQSIKDQETALKEAVKASLITEIPDEPPLDSNVPITKFRFRVPDSDAFERAFTKTTLLQTVVNFLYVKGYPADEYKYLQSWPRRCLTQCDLSKSLEELRFPNQEMITVEERLGDED